MPTLKSDQTVIAVSIETRDRLKTLGIKGEKYDSIIQRLINKENSQGVGNTPQQIPHPLPENKGVNDG